MAPRWTSDCIAARQLIDDFHDGNIDVDDKKPDTKAVWDSRECYKVFPISTFRSHYNKAWSKFSLTDGNNVEKSKSGKCC